MSPRSSVSTELPSTVIPRKVASLRFYHLIRQLSGSRTYKQEILRTLNDDGRRSHVDTLIGNMEAAQQDSFRQGSEVNEVNPIREST
jgi:hypothetical protein